MALPAGWGEAALFEPGEAAWTDATRSHDHWGAVLAWRLPPGVAGACDMERLDVDVEALSRRLGVAPDGFHESWVAAEASAKLADVPIVLWLRRHGLAADPALLIHRRRVAGSVVAFARRNG